MITVYHVSLITIHYIIITKIHIYNDFIRLKVLTNRLYLNKMLT